MPISPISVIRVDWQTTRLDVALTNNQVERSPNIDTDKPISRQHEIAYSGYYGYPYYWGGAFLGGPSELSGRCGHAIQAFYRTHTGQKSEKTRIRICSATVLAGCISESKAKIQSYNRTSFAKTNRQV